ncbi:MAG TPA: 3-hydroxyacyl-CoA dehydrogenase/enoyl-CoA hydratase family protein [Steroidobacteraceae bacterium]|nr:3-hydroxyacyl-CoA dehydrogenase/enoyl-CoA hydratase family protein [Steroidobacteraceae bacterium]
MPDTRFIIRKAAVLGAGVMGAQIAAHLLDARVPTILFDLPAKDGDKSGIVKKAVEGLKRLQPSPLAGRDTAALIRAANYDEHLSLLAGCDLVIEAIAERLDWKTDLYRRIAPHLGPRAIFASNTSGLAIAKLAEALPQELRPRFCGVHFFNPPRYMHLAEIIPCAQSQPAVLDALERFLVTTLGKGVVRAKDTPNFVANRLGVFSMLATIANAEKFGIPFDVVDDLTGPRLGRPKSATFRTADVVGLDTFAHVVKTMQDSLPQDPWRALFRCPPWLTRLIEAGALGAKTRSGIYRKKGNDLRVLDPASGEHVEAGRKADGSVVEILKLADPAQRLGRLRSSDHPQAQFLWACLRDVFHYSAHHLAEIAHSARDVDFAIRWGFGWKMGPFEIWQAAGWTQVARWIEEDIAAGKALAGAPLPAWARDPDRKGVHFPAGSYDADGNRLVGPSTLDVYRRQLWPDTVLGAAPRTLGDTVYENAGVRAFTTGDDVLVVSFKTKAHSISPDVLEGLNHALDMAEESYKGLVIWQPEAPFSVGANLESLRSALAAGDLKGIEAIIAHFQRTSMHLRYSAVPTVAATQGYVFGGGCEFVMHCDRVVAALESYVGLVEAGVGLLPAGGGCKELALRAARESKGDLFAALKDYYMLIATAKVAGSGIEAQDAGYLRPSDAIVLNSGELLHVAKQQALALYEAGYRPPVPGRRFAVAGRAGAASIKGQLVNMLEGHFISEYDFEIGSRIAEVMTGGDLEPGTEVDEEWLLALERRHFLELLKSPKTQERIAHTLATGKPLRN